MVPPQLSAIVGACSASTNQADCEKALDKDSSSAWYSGSTSPSWLVIHLKYPTTLNLVHITHGDPPCTEFGIQLEVDGVFVEPLGIEVDLSKYVIKENQIIIPPETKESKIRFSTLKKITGIRLYFSLPANCQVQEVSLFHSHGSSTGRNILAT